MGGRIHGLGFAHRHAQRRFRCREITGDFVSPLVRGLAFPYKSRMRSDTELQRRETIAKSAMTAVFCMFLIYLHYLNSLKTGKVVDFTAFYTAAQMLRHGAAHQLFDFNLQRQFQEYYL